MRDQAQRLLLPSGVIAISDKDLQAALAQAYEAGVRPRCLCREAGVEMYIARYERYVVKCMPGTGRQHEPQCPSFLTEQEGEHEAIRAGADGRFDVLVKFSLMSRGASPGRSESAHAGDATRRPRPFTLTALLHLLIDHAQINRWSPPSQRPYHYLQREIEKAAANFRIKGHSLSDVLFIPETYDPKRKLEVLERRRHRVRALLHRNGIQSPRAVLVGELKHSEPGNLLRRVWLKHMPERPILVEEKTWKLATVRFRGALEALDAGLAVRVLLAAVISDGTGQEIRIESCALVLTTKSWIPIAGSFELDLHDRLVSGERTFYKPLRYDASSWTQLPNFVLLDAGPEPVPLHVIDPWADQADIERKRKVAEGSWIWQLDQPAPPLPHRDTLPIARNENGASNECAV
ncbi:DUF1173 family protein [Zemynaea arenosa]|nr:DUF1173 family protein [Massilia arenosa]